MKRSLEGLKQLHGDGRKTSAKWRNAFFSRLDIDPSNPSKRPFFKTFAAFSLTFLLYSCQQMPHQAARHDGDIYENSAKMIDEGRAAFRYDTFGNEAYWGEVLRLHEVIAGEKNGGTGPGISPRKALELGFKFDSEKLSGDHLRMFREDNSPALDDPATTLALLKSGAIIGLKGFFDGKGAITSIGIGCSLCHSNVNDSVAHGAGSRLDGWPNRDINMGSVIARSPNLRVMSMRIGTNPVTLKKSLEAWGPGKYDSILMADGRVSRPDLKPSPTIIPSLFGLSGVSLCSYNGWGSMAYKNAFEAVLSMRGKGNFFDLRLTDSDRFPVASRTGDWSIKTKNDVVTPKLAALHYYQLSLPVPVPPQSYFDEQMAQRGRALFEGKAKCATCHVPPLYTEPGWAMHGPDTMGMDNFQASRSPDGSFYRTTPLRGLFTKVKGGFYHDGRFPDLKAVVEHYNDLFQLNLTRQEKIELLEFLRSL